jgi:hypothetical protein
VVDPSPCASVGAEQNQQANQTFNSRIPLPGPVAAEAAPVTERIRESLERLTAHQRLEVSAVQSALLAGGMQSTDLWVFKGAAADGVGFGGYEQLTTPTGVCAWGTVSVKAIDLETGGITRDGAAYRAPEATDRQRAGGMRRAGIRRIRIPRPAAGSPRTPPRCPSRR